MTENVKKIFELFKNNKILSILESNKNYIVSICDKTLDASSVTETVYAVDKRTFNISEFSYFNNPDEYAEACNNVIYKNNENDKIVTPDNELSHAGVKGMKWGVRNSTGNSSTGNSKRTHTSSDGTVTTTKTRGNKTTITSKNGNSKAKLTVKRNKGAKLVAKHDNAKIKVIISNTANVAAGAMRVAAAFVPGMSVLNGVATAASLVGTVAALKK